MKVSTKGRYGLQAMLDLALQSSSDHVSLSSIAERQGISLNYLEQIFSSLRKAGLVKSAKGAQGGYTLARHPAKITVGQILRVMETDLFQIAQEEEYGRGFDVQMCLQHSVWEKIQEKINELVDNFTLEDLKDDYHKMCQTSSTMYYI